MPLYEVMSTFKSRRLIDAPSKREAIQIAEQSDDDDWELLDDIPITARLVKLTEAAKAKTKGASYD